MTHPVNRPFIMVAPNGARRGRGDHPALPVTSDQLALTAVACHRAGADALHLHVRDGQGGHSLDAGRYREALAEIAAHVPQMPVQVTTEAAGVFDVAAQLACLRDLRPQWASVSVREIARAPELARQVYGLCADQGIRVQHILYDTADIAQMVAWRDAGIIAPEQDQVLFVLGRYRENQQSSPADLAPFRAALPDARDWMVCAFGAREHACLAAAATQGGQLRVGFENSLTDADGTPYPDNAASVAALRSLLERQP